LNATVRPPPKAADPLVAYGQLPAQNHLSRNE
jgi:hypothetical protein